METVDGAENTDQLDALASNTGIVNTLLPGSLGDESHTDGDNLGILLDETVCNLARERSRCTEGIVRLNHLILQKTVPCEASALMKKESLISVPALEVMEPTRIQLADAFESRDELVQDIPDLISQCHRFQDAVSQNQDMLSRDTDRILFSAKKPRSTQKFGIPLLPPTSRIFTRSMSIVNDDTPTRRKSPRLNRPLKRLENSVSSHRTRHSHKSMSNRIKHIRTPLKFQ